jgi:hypothetical protein
MNQLTINNTVIEIFIGDIINADYDAIAMLTTMQLPFLQIADFCLVVP